MSIPMTTNGVDVETGAAATAEAFPYPPTNLIETDGEPLESEWRRLAMNLLIDIVCFFLRDRDDYFVGGNMFIYYSARQAKTLEYRGPDFFFVWGRPRQPMRPYWAVWDEDGHYPNVIIELSSPHHRQSGPHHEEGHLREEVPDTRVLHLRPDRPQA
jgi:Uma2 family endonuclease